MMFVLLHLHKMAFAFRGPRIHYGGRSREEATSNMRRRAMIHEFCCNGRNIARRRNKTTPIWYADHPALPTCSCRGCWRRGVCRHHKLLSGVHHYTTRPGFVRSLSPALFALQKAPAVSPRSILASSGVLRTGPVFGGDRDVGGSSWVWRACRSG